MDAAVIITIRGRPERREDREVAVRTHVDYQSPLALRLTDKGFDVPRSNLISAAAPAGKTIKDRLSADPRSF